VINVVEGKTCRPPELVKANIGQFLKWIGFTRQGAYYYALYTGMRDVYIADLNSTTGLSFPRSQAHFDIFLTG